MGPIVTMTPETYWQTWVVVGIAAVVSITVALTAALTAVAWWLGPTIIAKGIELSRMK